MAMGAVNLKLGVLRVSRWFPGFDPSNYKLTTSKICIRLHDLPLEYRKVQNILNITVDVGLPLKIDLLTLNLYHGMYVSVLVDVDFT